MLGLEMCVTLKMCLNALRGLPDRIFSMLLVVK